MFIVVCRGMGCVLLSYVLFVVVNSCVLWTIVVINNLLIGELIYRYIYLWMYM